MIVLLGAAWLDCSPPEFTTVSCGSAACPATDCSDLQTAGIQSVCKNGIIASCDDGVHMQYAVCVDAYSPVAQAVTTVCEQSWQQAGSYRCAESANSTRYARPTPCKCSSFSGTGVGGSAGSPSCTSGIACPGGVGDCPLWACYCVSGTSYTARACISTCCAPGEVACENACKDDGGVSSFSPHQP